jgi:recombination protein RecA
VATPSNLLGELMSKFLDKFKKAASKIDGVGVELHEPTFWLDSGNYVINKLVGGTYLKAFPQGKLSAIAGPSSTGKTFVASNCAKFALDQGIGVLYIDTENAIDEGHFKAIGIDPHHPLLAYSDVRTITQTVKVVSTFIKEFRDSGETTPFLIIIDSLDMLETDTDAENYDKGDIVGGQGQKEKQLKKMLGAFVHDIKSVPMHMICTKQVYVNQDKYTNKIEPWKFTECLKFAFSQILLVTKLMLKDKTSGAYKGFKLKAFGFKTRFTKPFQQAEIDIPYDTGMDPFTGLLGAAESFGIVKKNGSWYEYNGEKFQSTSFELVQERVLKDIIALGDKDLVVNIEVEEDLSEAENDPEVELTPAEAKEAVKKKFKK